MDFGANFLGVVKGAEAIGGVPATETVKEQGASGLSFGQGLTEIMQPKVKEGEAPTPKPTSSGLNYNVDDLMEKLIFTESGGVHKEKDGTLRVSKVGAQGITQLMPKTAKNPGYGITPVADDSPEEYIRFGRDYLTKMIEVFGDVEQGVAAYNAGPGKIHSAISKAARSGKDWKDFLPQETKDYIKKVK